MTKNQNDNQIDNQNENLVVKIFKEQMDLIQSLPTLQEKKDMLYNLIYQCFYQFDNQNENQNDNQFDNQNENAYISNSNSNSILYNSIYGILKKTIILKKFSSNYGGKRK